MPERSALGSLNGDQFTLLTKMMKPRFFFNPAIPFFLSPPSLPPFVTYVAPQCLRNLPSSFTGCVAGLKSRCFRQGLHELMLHKMVPC